MSLCLRTISINLLLAAIGSTAWRIAHYSPVAISTISVELLFSLCKNNFFLFPFHLHPSPSSYGFSPFSSPFHLLKKQRNRGVSQMRNGSYPLFFFPFSLENVGKRVGREEMPLTMVKSSVLPYFSWVFQKDPERLTPPKVLFMLIFESVSKNQNLPRGKIEKDGDINCCKAKSFIAIQGKPFYLYQKNKKEPLHWTKE